MSWIEPNHQLQQRVCIVCGKRTRESVAPLGIVSGTVRCCHEHDNRAIMTAYFDLMRTYAKLTQDHSDD